MTVPIRKVAVIGAGVMGSAIAAHLANNGMRVLLLDIVPAELAPEELAHGLSLASAPVRNRFAARGLDSARQSRPAAFYDMEDARLIEVGNMEDDFEKLVDYDWIIEAVIEDVLVKRQLLARLETVVRSDTVVSSNTSGIPIAEMSALCSDSFAQNFLGTHFFNPPRYMKLLEIIPGPKTDPKWLSFFRDFGERVLGKGVVIARDTPNFIANRIGTYGLLATLAAMQTHHLGVDEVDAITGPVMGRPKSATFRTLDLVGLDTFVHVANNVQAAVSDLWEKAAFAVPPYIEQMVAQRWIGDKSGQGFFKTERSAAAKEIFAIDLDTMSYRPVRKLTSSVLKAAKRQQTLTRTLQTLVYGEDAVAQFAWDVLKATLLYTATIQEQIADNIVAVDAAMKWGFNWDMGPYETWDAIGLQRSVERMRGEGDIIPVFVEELLASGQQSFYRRPAGQTPTFYVGSGRFGAMTERPERIDLARLKAAGKTVRKNNSASLIDIGDGVVCLEFHSLKQAIDPDVVAMIGTTVEELSQHWDALVIGNQASTFAVGANILLMLMEAQQGHWDNLESALNEFQQATLRLKYVAKPVVAAPFQMALGGGAEVCLPADRIQAAAETYIGLVEVGIGLIPGGGGNKEMLMRLSEIVPADVSTRLDPFVRKAFENIAMARVSSSAKDARKLGFLRPADNISANPDFLLHDAKQVALGLARAGYQPPQPKRIPVVGEDGAALLQVGVYQMQQSGYLSEHDVKVAKHLINVLTGGSVARGTLVTEQYLLDLERAAFLSLIGESKTQERMQHMLLTSKPLRN